MKFFHSTRWRLQLWHGLLLALVLAGFGFTAWQLQQANQMNRTDHELEQRMGLVEASLLPRNGPGSPPPPDKPRWTAREQNLFDGMPGQEYYYAIWQRDGRQSAASASAAGYPAQSGRGATSQDGGCLVGPLASHAP